MDRKKPVENIVMTKNEYQRKGSKWVLKTSEKSMVSDEYHKNVTDKATLKFFRSLGGAERNDYGYTHEGYKVIRNTKLSPDRQTKIIRDFDFRRE